MSYRDEVLADRPLLWLPAGEYSSPARDWSGYSRSVTTTGSPTFGVSGLRGGEVQHALRLSGSQGFSIPDSTDLNVPELSWEFWVSTTLAADQIPMARDNSTTGTRYWFLRIRSTGVLNLLVNCATGTPQDGVTAVNDGKRHHIVVTYSAPTARFYIDGRLDATVGGGIATPTSGTQAVTIGYQSNPVQFVTGDIQDIALYPRVLDAARVLAHYRSGVNGVAPRLHARR